MIHFAELKAHMSKNVYFVFLCKDPCTYRYGISELPYYASMLIMFKVMTFYAINNVKAVRFLRKIRYDLQVMHLLNGYIYL